MKYLRFFCLICCFSITSCNNEPSQPSFTVTLDNSYPLSIPEASGLSLAADKNSLLLVSDTEKHIYRISFTGEILQTLIFTGDDMEGISVNTNDGSLWIVDEKAQEVIQLDADGTELQRFKLDLVQTDLNGGMEGIAYNSGNGQLFVVTEKSPSNLLLLSSQGTILETHALTFALDYSALSFDPIRDELWMYSDQSMTLTKTNLIGERLEQVHLGIAEGEGLVVDREAGKVYLVSDTPSMLYVFTLQ